MKRALFILLCVLCCLAAAPAACGAEPEDPLGTMTETLPGAARDVMEQIDFNDGDALAQGIAVLLQHGRAEVQQLLRGLLHSAAALLLIVLLTSGVRLLYFQKQDAPAMRCASMTGALAIVLLSAGSLSDLLGLGTETIYTMNDFSKTLLPVMGMACAASGGIASAAVRETATAFFADLLITCINRLLVPLVYLYIGAITADAVLHQHSLKSIANGIRKFTAWVLTILLSIFTAYLAISGVISGTADAAALKVAKFAISGAVPVVGGVMSDAASTVLVGAAILKNTIGLFGMLAVFALCITPFLQIGMQYLLYKLTAFLAEVVDQSGLSELMEKIGGAFGMLLGMTGACALLLIISMMTSIAAVMPV